MKFKQLLNFPYEGDITIAEVPVHVKASLTFTQAPTIEFGTFPAAYMEEMKVSLRNDYPEVADWDDLSAPSTIKFALDKVNLHMETSQGTALDNVVKAEVYASVHVENGVLKAESLSSKIYIDGYVDPIFTFIAETLCGILKQKIDKLPLPHFEKFYIDAGLKNANINVTEKKLQTEIELTKLDNTIYIPHLTNELNAVGTEIDMESDSNQIKLAASMINIPGVSWQEGLGQTVGVHQLHLTPDIIMATHALKEIKQSLYYYR